MFQISPRFDIPIEERIKGILENRINYIRIPEEDISLGDKKSLILTQFPVITNLNLEDFHRILLGEYNKGIPSQVDGLNLLLLLLSDKQVYDGNNNRISSERRKEMLDYMLSETWEYFSTRFTKEESGKIIVNHNYRINKEGKLVPQYSQPLGEGVLKLDCYVDLGTNSFNSQGLPVKVSESKQQIYKKGENIYSYHPRNGSVARLVADSDGAILNCSGDPSNLVARLGVRAKFLEE